MLKAPWTPINLAPSTPHPPYCWPMFVGFTTRWRRKNMGKKNQVLRENSKKESHKFFAFGARFGKLHQKKSRGLWRFWGFRDLVPDFGGKSFSPTGSVAVAEKEIALDRGVWVLGVWILCFLLMLTSHPRRLWWMSPFSIHRLTPYTTEA